MAKLILALDFDDSKKALALIDKLDPKALAVKVGSELFTLFGANFVQKIINKGFKVFLDLKFHDIPNTVANACKACADIGVWMLNVHALGGKKMMEAAREALCPFGREAPLLIAVTLLTSFKEADLSPLGIKLGLQEEVIRLAQLSQAAGLNGVVASAHEVAAIKAICGQSFLTISPGIRPLSARQDDQHRIMTPKEAKKQGSDYLVIGRPITKAMDPALVVTEILQELTSADPNP